MREIIDLADLSPAGATDVLRRLSEAHLITSKRIGNKKLFSVNQQSGTSSFIHEALTQHRKTQLRQRAERYSAKSTNVLAWIDETSKGLKLAKQKFSTARAS